MLVIIYQLILVEFCLPFVELLPFGSFGRSVAIVSGIAHTATPILASLMTSEERGA